MRSIGSFSSQIVVAGLLLIGSMVLFLHLLPSGSSAESLGLPPAEQITYHASNTNQVILATDSTAAICGQVSITDDTGTSASMIFVSGMKSYLS